MTSLKSLLCTVWCAVRGAGIRSDCAAILVACLTARAGDRVSCAASWQQAACHVTAFLGVQQSMFYVWSVLCVVHGGRTVLVSCVIRVVNAGGPPLKAANRVVLPGRAWGTPTLHTSRQTQACNAHAVLRCATRCSWLHPKEPNVRPLNTHKGEGCRALSRPLHSLMASWGEVTHGMTPSSANLGPPARRARILRACTGGAAAGGAMACWGSPAQVSTPWLPWNSLGVLRRRSRFPCRALQTDVHAQ